MVFVAGVALTAAQLNAAIYAPGLATILGPSSTLDVTTGVAIVTLPTVAVTVGRTYLIGASFNGLQITSAATVSVQLVETNSGFAPVLTPPHTASPNDSVPGSFSGLWSPGAGQTAAIWKINCSSTVAALRVFAVTCSISMIDVT